MVLAVLPTTSTSCDERCQRHRVDSPTSASSPGAAVLVVRSGGSRCSTSRRFLHDGRPQRRMNAIAARRQGTAGRRVDDPGKAPLALLAHPNIASKAAVVHRYDHEIGGATLVRPLAGRRDHGHADGVVLAHPDEDHGIAVGIGVNPWYGLHDPEAMAEVVVDEAIRNVVAVGADPDRVALLDNFSWGDPQDRHAPARSGEAVGCCAAAESFNAPFVSGKDSLNNTYTGSDGRRHAVPPTLVVTAIAHVPDVSRCVTPELVAPGNVLLLLGDTGKALRRQPPRPAHRRHRARPGSGITPQLDPDRQRVPGLHQAIRAGSSRHVTTSAKAARRRPRRDVHRVRLGSRRSTRCPDVTTALFSESAGRFVIEVHGDDVERSRRSSARPRLGTVPTGL